MLIHIYDLDSISNFEKQCFKHNPYTNKNIEDLLKSSECYGFYSNTTKLIQGYMIVQKQGDDYEINRIGVLPAHQNQKIAYEHFKLWLKQTTAHKCFLEVEASNSNAIKLYKKCGFNIVSKRLQYYRNGSDAYVMQLNCLS